LRSGGSMPADHIQSLSRGPLDDVSQHDPSLPNRQLSPPPAHNDGETARSSASAVPADTGSGSVSSARHFLKTLSSSSLSYMSRSSVTEFTRYCSLSLVTKYGKLVQHAITDQSSRLLPTTVSNVHQSVLLRSLLQVRQKCRKSRENVQETDIYIRRDISYAVHFTL